MSRKTGGMLSDAARSSPATDADVGAHWRTPPALAEAVWHFCIRRMGCDGMRQGRRPWRSCGGARANWGRSRAWMA